MGIRRMSEERTVRIDIDRAYDLRLLAALPSTLDLFARGTLQAQLDDMAAHRRAICFTLMAPVVRQAMQDTKRGEPEVATVLVCLHVAPDVAAAGLEALLKIVSRAAASVGNPIHQATAPLAGGRSGAGQYREAVYLVADASIAITTHTPVQLPVETLAAVAPVTAGAAVDIVTTVAITRWHPESVAALREGMATPRPTLH